MATHVFYSPHSDDEAIGMAGAIIRAKAIGDSVVLVLVTDNLPSARALSRFDLSPEDLAEARLREFRRAASILSVDEIRYFRISESAIVEDRQHALATLLGSFSSIDHEFGDDGSDVIHHTVMGAGDIHQELGRGTSAHGLCEDAAVLFAVGNPFTDIFVHGVYVYSFPLEERGRLGMSVVELTPAELELKRRALDAYKASGDCIGYGYDSVPELIDAAANDPREYFWKL